MPRYRRLNKEDAHYHIFNRGHSKQSIFLARKHYIYFLKLVAMAKQEYTFQIYSYCLMKNHYHLQIRTQHANISKIMEFIGRKYAKFFNKEVGRIGPLWQSRFKSVLVDSEQYLLQLNRYIHRNPVAASCVTNPSDYQWSSIHSYLRPNQNRIIDTAPILDYFVNINDYEQFQLLTTEDRFSKYYNQKYFPTKIGFQ